jgi:hypothetical protein
MSTKSQREHFDVSGRNGKTNDSGELGKKEQSNISYRTLENFSPSQNEPKVDGTDCALSPVIVKRKAPKQTINPISNIPVFESSAKEDKGAPDTRRDLTVYRLQNEVQHMTIQRSDLLFKLARALEVIVSEEQFFNDGMHRDSWETYDQLMRRRSRLKGVRDLIMSAGTAHRMDEKDERELMRKIGIE